MNKNKPYTSARGYVLDNLGLNQEILAMLRQMYPDKSYHYAIQQILKAKVAERKQ